MTTNKTVHEWGFSGNPTDEHQVYEFIRDAKSNGHLYNEIVFKQIFPEIYFKITQQRWNIDWKFSQILYHYFAKYHSSDNIGKCQTCGSSTQFRSFTKGYSPYCSTKCSNSNKLKKQKTIDTCMKTYGVTNVFQSNDIKEKSKQTSNEKYGTDYPQQSQIVRDKIEETCISRIGVPCPFQMEGFQEKSKQTSNEKYGTNCPQQSGIVKQKLSNTYFEKHGYYNPSYNPDVIEKRRDTNYTHFGGKWVTQTDEFKDNNHQMFLQRHPNIIDETDDCYIINCCDCECMLCKDRIFSLDKNVYKQRTSGGYELCPIKCPIDGNKSKSESELLGYIRSIYNSEIIVSDRSILGTHEIDIYIPEKNLAIEFNGVFWYSDFNPRQTKMYHQQKSLQCLDRGIQLLHIWEDDWNLKKDIIKDYIRCKLGLCTNRIFARKCEIREITPEQARPFLNENHIQGYVNSQIKIGLFFNNELVEAMTIGKLRNTMGSTPKDGSYEIYRVVSKRGYLIVGGVSKMLRYFETTYSPREIITYGDLCYTTGNVYEKCGFTKETLSSPCYSWQINGKRYHRSNFMKHKLEECKTNPKLTENEVMRSRHAYKIWDAGKIKFTKHAQYHNICV